VPEPGQQVGEYIIEAEIGGGGMAKVYRARHSVLDTLHALKVLDPKYRTNADARKRFLDEAKIQAKHLDHPNIVKVTNIVATSDIAALVMELISGGNLEHLIEKRRKPLAVGEFMQLAVPILDAIGHAHDAGIIHRDIKPANVLISKDGDQMVPKLTDFGIAKVGDKLSSKKKSTHADARMGTLAYMSPEQIRQAKNVTARSDIFSIGAMFYEMATGNVPFDGDSDFDIMEKIVHGRYEEPEKKASPELPSHVVAAIRRAMMPKPEQRFASCREFTAALGGESVAVGAVPLPRARVAGGGRRWGVFALLLLLALGAGGAAVFLATRGDKGKEVAVTADAGSPVLTAGGDGTRGEISESLMIYDASVPAPPDAAPPPPPDAAPPPDARKPRPPKKSRCIGRWSGKDFALNIKSKKSSCGSITFISGPMKCQGALTGCSVSHTSFRGSYSCKYNRTGPAPLRGSVNMSCKGTSASPSVRVNRVTKTKYVRKR